MPRRRSASALPQQPESVVEERRGLPDPVRVDPAGNQLDRERDAVELAADLANDGSIGVAQREATSACGSAFNEKLHRREGQRLCGGEAGAVRRTLQRQQSVDNFASSSQRLATRRQDMNLRRAGKKAFSQRRRRLDHMLATI